MAKRDEIIAYLDEFLEIAKFRDKVLNGLQVIGKPEVNRIALGVSPSLEVFKKAADAKADMIILHHGLITEFEPSQIDAIKKARLKTLFDHDMTLLAYHLPLDGHFDSGNNAQIMKRLGLECKETFAPYSGQNIGIIGTFSEPKPFEDLKAEAEQLFGPTVILNYGKPQVNSVAIISGAGGASMHEVITAGVDVFITGEPKEHVDALAKEAGIHVIFAGHYNTEKWGVQALGKVLEEKFHITATFIDIPCAL